MGSPKRSLRQLIGIVEQSISGEIKKSTLLLRDSRLGFKCTVDGKDNKEDNTREEADMTFSLFFPKVSKAVQN